MIKLIIYANALLAYAHEKGLDEIYSQALSVYEKKTSTLEDVPEEIGEFLQQVPEEDRLSVIYWFLTLVREKMDILEAEVVSAVPLTEKQLLRVESCLINKFGNQMEITTRVDPSILAGLRIIVCNMVMDSTIKRKLQDLEKNIYKGVFDYDLKPL